MPPFLCNYNDLGRMSRAGRKKVPFCQSWLHLLLLFFVLFWPGHEDCRAAVNSGEVISAQVLYVVDGDTLEIRYQGQKQRVRLWGIDSPEWQQGFSREAREFVRNRVQGRRVELQVKGWDKYGRLLAALKVEGNSLNEELLRAGMAWVHIYYCKESVCREWRRLEKDARIGGRGLWREDNPVPPWEWKRSHR